jgi:hypothetical protein
MMSSATERLMHYKISDVMKGERGDAPFPQIFCERDRRSPNSLSSWGSGDAVAVLFCGNQVKRRGREKRGGKDKVKCSPETNFDDCTTECNLMHRAHITIKTRR